MTYRTASFVAALFAAFVCMLPAALPSPARASDTLLDEAAEAATNADEIEQSIASPSSNRHYFTVTPDPRLCPSPLCGGYWLTRVNRPFTVCADGRQAPRCYVPELDFSLSGFSSAQQNAARSAGGHLLLRGFIEPKDFGAFGNLGVFSVREAWIGHRGAVASGTFYRARTTGIVCIAFPCPSFAVEQINRAERAQRIADMDLHSVSADPSDGYKQLAAPDGLMTAGDLVPVSGPAGSSFTLVSSEYYLPIAPELDICGSRGLPECTAGEFCNFTEKAGCGRADVPGVCAVRPQACTLIYDPVCGCDGNTYSDECAAHAAGVSVDHGGACGG